MTRKTDCYRVPEQKEKPYQGVFFKDRCTCGGRLELIVVEETEGISVLVFQRCEGGTINEIPNINRISSSAARSTLATAVRMSMADVANAPQGACWLYAPKRNGQTARL